MLNVQRVLARIVLLLFVSSIASPRAKTGKSIFTSDSILTSLGRWAWGPCYAVETKDHNAFIGNGPTFQVLDIANPSSPQIIGEYYVGASSIFDIRVRDSLAFVIADGLLILDISNLSRPQKIGFVSISGWTNRVVVVDSFAYVITYAGGMCVVDISNPSQPRLRGALVTGFERSFCLAARGRYVYVGSFEYPFFAIINANDPDHLTGNIIDIGGWALSAFTKDTLLYVGLRSQVLKVFSVANPSLPIQLGETNIDTANYYGIQSITVRGNYAYVATRLPSVYSVDISNPYAPHLSDSIHYRFPSLSEFNGLSVATLGATVLASYQSGVWLVNATQPSSLSEQAFFPTGGFATKVAMRDSLAFVASADAGLWVLDISNPNEPRSLSNLRVGGELVDVMVSDNLVFAVNQNQVTTVGLDNQSRGLWIFNVFDPGHPRVLSHYIGATIFSPNNSYVGALAKSGDLVFMTQPGSDSTFEIINATNPNNPQRLGVFRSTYLPYDVAIKDSIAYLATQASGLRIIDCHTPSSPMEIASFTTSSLWGIAIGSSFAYADRIDTFFVVDISNPRIPSVVGKFGRNYGSFSTINLFACGNFVYWAEGYLGVVDVSNPSNPREVARISSPDWGSGVAAQGNLILFAETSYGVSILRNNLVTSVGEEGGNALPVRGELYQNYPNPFNPTTTISYALSVDAQTTLKVYDILGREVTTIVDHFTRAGVYQVKLDATSFSSGVYFYRLIAGSFVATKKLLLTR
jgi:hypothetical protein